MPKKPDTSSQLFLAVENGHSDMLEAMLSKKGARLNVRENLFGMTALHVAASKGDKTIVELLLTRGADIEAREDTGRTPLHTAAFRGYHEIVELLLLKGAKVNAQTNDGKTPLDWAILNSQVRIAETIRAAGGKYGKELTDNSAVPQK
jgi:ankyrin repeat protein